MYYYYSTGELFSKHEMIYEKLKETIGTVKNFIFINIKLQVILINIIYLYLLYLYSK